MTRKTTATDPHIPTFEAADGGLPDLPAVDDPAPEFVSTALSLPTRAVIARKTLSRILPSKIRRAIERGEPVAVLLETTSAAWTDAIAAQIEHVYPSAKYEAATKASAKNTRPSTPSADRPLLVITQNANWLSPAVATGCDFALRVRADPKVIAETIGEICGRRVKISGSDIAGLDLTDFAFAIRRGTTAQSCRARMRRAAEAKATGGVKDNTPPLHELCGYGAALDVVRNVAEAVTRRSNSGSEVGPSPSVLLFGAPGAGKTTLARSFARTVNMPLVATSVASWFSTTDGHLGDVAAAAQRFFDQAAAAAPSIAFLDELDALPNRETLPADRAEWWTTLVTGVLLGIDNLRQRYPDVVLIGATNHKDRLDAALIRPGRFDVHVEIAPPDSVDELAGVFRQHLGKDLAKVDLTPVAELAFGATGAAARCWVQAARRVAGSAHRALEIGDLIDAIAPPDERSPASLLNTALHEAAHAVVATSFGIPIRSISIIKTDQSLGRTRFVEQEGAVTREDLELRATAILAGRAADEILSGAADTGALGDLINVTNTVTSIHCTLGLAGSLITLAPHDDPTLILRLDHELRSRVSKDIDVLMERSRSRVRLHEAAIRRLADRLVAKRVAYPRDISWAMTPDIDEAPASPPAPDRLPA